MTAQIIVFFWEESNYMTLQKTKISILVNIINANICIILVHINKLNPLLYKDWPKVSELESLHTWQVVLAISTYLFDCDDAACVGDGC